MRFDRDRIGNGFGSARFGGAHDRRDSPNISVRGSGSISRKGLQQLEKAGLIQNIRGKGRTVTAKGRKFLDNAAYEVSKELAKSAPEMVKY